MNSDRIRQIQKRTAYPDSISVQQALLQVWNECEQEKLSEQKNPRQPTEKDALQRAVDWWLENGMQKFIGAPAWVFDARALLEPEEKNPWRPIVNDDWPECRPMSKITLKYEDGTTIEVFAAGDVGWNRADAIAWRYTEDE